LCFAIELLQHLTIVVTTKKMLVHFTTKKDIYVTVLVIYFRLGSDGVKPKVMTKQESSEEEEEEEEELTEEEKGEIVLNCVLCFYFLRLLVIKKYFNNGLCKSL